MSEPAQVARPWMPGYGIAAGDAGSGLLPWAWAVEQLTSSRHFWAATTWPDGRPHITPVWAVWLDDALWFSCGGRSRKARNLTASPACSLTTQDPLDPVMLTGDAGVQRSPEAVAAFLAALNAKYATDYDGAFFDPDVNWTVRVPPRTVIALRSDDFIGTPTRWTF